MTEATYQTYCLIKEKKKKDIWVLIPSDIVKNIMVKYHIKKGGDNYTSKGHIIPKEKLLNLSI